ncbi:prolipoprotein diacylglyceryl transferase [Candidatus Woesearchaeota archaeon]|nr:prolipoprotein diacylglyceryl transferase [Candidatus Woesearchaeota archaeon]
MLPYFTLSSFKLGFITIHVWGIFAALGFIVGMFFASREAAKRGLDPDAIHDSAPWVMLGAIVGARIVFLLENPWAVSGFFDIFSVWNGGLAFHGGFFGGVGVFLAYMRHKGLSVLRYSDAIAPGIAIGHAVGRLGCHVTGMHVGKESSLPWSIFHEGAARHPVILYEIAALLLIFFVLLWVRERKFSRVDGRVFFMYIALYSFARFFIEFFRTDPVYFGFSAAQFIVVAVFAASLFFLFRK